MNLNEVKGLKKVFFLSELFEIAHSLVKQYPQDAVSSKAILFNYFRTSLLNLIV